MIAHEAHHRGQTCMLTHQLGFPLPNEVTAGMWNWEKLWKEGAAPGQELVRAPHFCWSLNIYHFCCMISSRLRLNSSSLIRPSCISPSRLRSRCMGSLLVLSV